MVKEIFQIPKSYHGIIIGSQGVTIRRLKKEFLVNITLPKRFEKKNDVIVEGRSVKLIEEARLELSRLLKFEVGKEKIEAMWLDVPISSYGTLIGCRGSTIQKIQKDSGSNLTIPRDKKQKYVRIEGTKADIEKGIALINEILGKSVSVVTNYTDTPLPMAHEKYHIDINVVGPIEEVLFFPDRDMSDGNNFDIFSAYLASATKTMDIAIYNATHDTILQILLQEHKEGTKIRIITDNDSAVDGGSDIDALRKAGIPVKMDKDSAIMHHKFCIIDGKLLLNGSFNWTNMAAQYNQENIMISNNPTLIKKFSSHFNKMWNNPRYFVWNAPTSKR